MTGGVPPRGPAFTVSVVDLVVLGAELMEGILEHGGPNRGPGVEACQRVTGNKPGDAWCASAVARAGSKFLGKRWPLPLTASCDELLEFARLHGALRTDRKCFEWTVAAKLAADADRAKLVVPPRRGMVFLVMRTAKDSLHCGFVRAVKGDGVAFKTIEGNTNPAGGREGYGMFPRDRGHPSDPAFAAGYAYAYIDWEILVR